MEQESGSGAHDSRLRAATESTLALAVNRFLTPILLGLIAWFGSQAFADIRQSQKESTAQVQMVSAKVQVLDTKLDFGVLQQVKDLRARVDVLEQQIRTNQGGKP